MNRDGDLTDRSAIERLSPREGFEGDDAEGPDVGSFIELGADTLLRAHVVRRTEDLTRDSSASIGASLLAPFRRVELRSEHVGVDPRVLQLGRPEVEKLH